ncbi:MAG TPA: TonB-dependent receptor [Patescibacteria group bacterium]|nr:TonB-dependent receptor [Patescibacteria group bacterium]
MRKNKQRLHSVLLVMLLALPLAGVEIHGTVKDIYNRPLPGVQIRIAPGGGLLVSNEKGEFDFTVDASESVLELYFETPLHYPEKRYVSAKESTPYMKVYLIPLKLLREDVTVTALNEAEKAISVPFAQSVVSKIEIRENQSETIVQAMQNSPGVHFIGKGGVSVTPSIRGLARRRILLLAAGARITSDRSAGASAQFYPPELVQQIEIVRSAASVLYGSDAIGGVIQIIPRDAQNAEPGFATMNISSHSADQKLNGGFSLKQKFGPYSVLAAMQISQADDYSAAGERMLNSGYRYYTGNLIAGYETEKRSFSLSFLKSAGRDIGKPERANDPAVSSFYPLENINLLNIAYRENTLSANSSLNFSLFLNPNNYELDKIKQSAKQVDIAKNCALDFGVRTTFKKSLDSHLSYQFGVDYYGRANVDMENETWKNGIFDSGSLPVKNGRRNDLGMYATLDYSGLADFDLVGGVRLGTFSRNAISDGVFLKKSSWAPAFFLGITRKIKDSLTLFFNVGTAYRLPSLSEAFYTGITGRSSIIGNSGLKPEKSLNLDAGLKIHRKNIFLGAYFFQYSVRDMIEKFPLNDTSYTYDNIEQGRIRGLELEFQFYPLKKLEIFSNAFYYQGRSTVSEKPLNDIPSAKLFLGVKYWLGRFWSEVNWLGSAAVKRPGPAETAIPAYSVTDVKAGCYFSNRLFVFLKIANLFDRAYFANADPDIPLAKGLDFSVGLNLSF